MPQVYEVQYQINVNNGPALEAIKQFQQATAQLEQLTRRFDAVSRSIGKLNSAFKSISVKPINVQVNTATAEANLKRVLTLIGRVQSRSKTSLSAPNMNNLVSSMQNVQKLTNSINRNVIKPKANTQAAINSLDALLRKINQVKANSKLTITTSAAGSASAVGAATGGRAVARRASAPGASRYLYPSTRQVLGPTYAQTGTNVGGEMIKGMGVAYGLSSLISGIGRVFRDATEYENISQTTKNILGAHDKRIGFDSDFSQMNQLMRQVGVETKFTAPQVASAGKFLAMAGYKVDDIRNSIRPISNLALIGDSNLGETADVVTNIMTGYEIPANQMNNVADILAMTFTKSNTTLMELAESFKYAGTVAHQSGLEFETTAAAIGVLGDAGIKASHAGTTLRMMLMNMQAPTKKQRAAWKALGVSPKDEAGNLKDFNTLMTELNEKSKTMSNGDFTSLFYQAFRVTAATGAMALVRHADKINEISDLNKSGSYGLSEELANAKKNTIEGLWYQMTSAFTESGMKGFEAMQGAIRSFLQQMIQLMQSPEFVQALSSAMQMFMRLVQVITDVFQSIMGVWNKLPNWAKDGLVYFTKIQMTLGIIAGIAQSILSTWLMIRGVIMGEWLSKLILKPITSVLAYMTQLYNIQRNIVGLSKGQALWQTLSGSWTHLRRLGGKTLAGVAGTTEAAVGSTVAAGATQATGTMARVGSSSLLGLGAMAGIWTAVAAAAIYAGYQIYDTIQVTNAARKANDEWAESYRNLGIAKLDLADPDALVLGNMRIYTSELHTQSEKLKMAGDMWHRYWQEKNGLTSSQEDDSKVADTNKDFKLNLKNADAWFGVSDAYKDVLKQLGIKVNTKTVHNYSPYGGGDQSYSTLNLFGRQLSYTGDMSENVAVQIALAQLGADPNNQEKVKMEKFLLSTATKANSYKDFQNIIGKLQGEVESRKWSSEWDFVDAEGGSEMTWGDIKDSQGYVRALKRNMLAVWQEWVNFGNVLRDVDAGQDVDIVRTQQVLFDRFGTLFDPQRGIFGTNSWIQNVKQIYNNPEAFGLDKKSSVEEISGYITKTFDDVIKFYDALDKKYKPYFAWALNRNPFEDILNPSYSLGEGGYSGPTGANQTTVIDGKTYKSGLLPPYTDKYVWFDKDGKQYTPKNSKPTSTWSPTNTGGKNSPASALHNGTDQSQYKSHYNQSAAPKQVIVRIENLMRVDKQTIDMTDSRQVAAINNIKQELATALLDVVQDFNANIV